MIYVSANISDITFQFLGETKMGGSAKGGTEVLHKITNKGEARSIAVQLINAAVEMVGEENAFNILETGK